MQTDQMSRLVFLALRWRLHVQTDQIVLSRLSGFTSETIHVQTNQIVLCCLSGFTSETIHVQTNQIVCVVFLALRRRLYRLTKSFCLSGFTSETVPVQTNQSSCLSGFTSETAPLCRLTNHPVFLAVCRRLRIPFECEESVRLRNTC